MQREQLSFKGQPLLIEISQEFNCVDVKRATPYGGRVRFPLRHPVTDTPVRVNALPFNPAYHDSSSYIEVTSEGVELTPDIIFSGNDSRLFGMPSTLYTDGTFEPPELPALLSFARDSLGWTLDERLKKVAALASKD